jgi:dihydroxyacetone kinase-like predicted kinase
VSGGQTLNPSTAELLAAVESAPSDQVVVLPNNKNIIAVAEQLDALTVKSVVVVPTRSMPEGLAALVVYDPEAPAASNAEQMAAAAEAVATGEVTAAVREAASDAGRVSAGDWIGLVRGDGIVSVGNSVVDVSTNLLDRLITSDRELVTVVVGDDATEADTDEILAWLADARPTVEVEVHEGGQPLYPYLFGVE